jgi:hypothetical protein
MASETPPRTAVVSWDWREQPDLQDLGRRVADISNGRAYLTEVATHCDDYALIVSTEPMTPDEAYEAYLMREVSR